MNTRLTLAFDPQRHPALPRIEYGRLHSHHRRWDDATGENLVEQIAAVGDYLVALQTYRAAVRRWPKDKITLRNRARVIERNWGG
jgi:hypothetical protein